MWERALWNTNDSREVTWRTGLLANWLDELRRWNDPYRRPCPLSRTVGEIRRRQHAPRDQDRKRPSYLVQCQYEQRSSHRSASAFEVDGDFGTRCSSDQPFASCSVGQTWWPGRIFYIKSACRSVHCNQSFLQAAQRMVMMTSSQENAASKPPCAPLLTHQSCAQRGVSAAEQDAKEAIVDL